MAEPQQVASSSGRNTMSIQEKIRMMKLTLDSQDHELHHPEEDERAEEENPSSSQSTNQSRVSALSSPESGAVITPSEEPNSTSRRSSVVDMWRKRESEIARRGKSDPSKPQNKPVQKRVQVPPTATTSPTLSNTSKSRQIATSTTSTGSSPFHNRERERIFNFEEKKEACHEEDQRWNEALPNPKPSFAAHARTHEMQSHSGLQIRTTFPHGKASPDDPSDHQRQRNDVVASPAAVDTMRDDSTRRSKTLPPLPTPTPSPAAASIQPESKVAESQAVENALGNSRLNDNLATSHNGLPQTFEFDDESPSKRTSRSQVRDMWLQREASSREMSSPMSMPQTSRSSSGRIIHSPSSKTTRKVGANKKFMPSSPSSIVSANRNSISHSSLGISSPASQSAPLTPRGNVADRWNSRGQNQTGESPVSLTEGSRSTFVDSSPVNNSTESDRPRSLSETGGEPESPQFNALKARWAKFGAAKVQAREGSTRLGGTRGGGEEEEQVPEPSSVVVSRAATSTERSVRDDNQDRAQEQKRDELRLDIRGTLETAPQVSPRFCHPPPVETNAIGEDKSHQNEKTDSNNGSPRKTPSRRQMLLRRRGRSGKQQSEVETANSMLSTEGSDLGSVSTGLNSADGALGFESSGGRDTGPVKTKKDFVKMGQKYTARPKPAGQEAPFVRPGVSNPSEEWPFVSSQQEDRGRNPWPAQQAQPETQGMQQQQHLDSQGASFVSGQKWNGRHEETRPVHQLQVRQPLDKKKYLSRLANRATFNGHDENSETSASDVPSDALSQVFEDAVPDDDYRMLSEQLTAPKNTSFQNTSSAIPIQTLLACGSKEEEVFGTPFYGGAKSNGAAELTASSRVLDPYNNTKAAPQNVSNKVKMQPYERMLIHDVLSSDGSSDIASYEGEDITVGTGVSSHSGGNRQPTSLASRAGRHLRERRLKKASSPANCDIVNENVAVVNPVTRSSPTTGQNERYIYPTDDKGTLSAGDKNLFGPGRIVPHQTDSLDDAARISIDSSDPLDIDFGAHHFHAEPSFNSGQQKVITPSDPQGFPHTGSSRRRSPSHSSNVPRRSPSFGSKNVSPFNTMMMMGPGEEKKMESSSMTSRNSSSERVSRKTASEHQKHGKEAGASTKSFTQNIGQMAKELTNDAETLLKANGLNFEKLASDFTEIAQDINVGVNIDAVSQSLNKGVSAASQSLNEGMTAASYSLNEGVTVASKSLNQFLAAKDVARSPQKAAAERLPSPVEEEIAIEVEYIEDYSDSSDAR